MLPTALLETRSSVFFTGSAVISRHRFAITCYIVGRTSVLDAGALLYVVHFGAICWQLALSVLLRLTDARVHALRMPATTDLLLVVVVVLHLRHSRILKPN